MGKNWSRRRVAKELLSSKESHRPIPEIVPKTGPKTLSIYTYVPPEVGIALANSDLERVAGNMQMAANK